VALTSKLAATIFRVSCDRSLLQKNPSIILAKLHVRDIGRKSLSIDCGGITFGMGDIIEDLSKSGIYLPCRPIAHDVTTLVTMHLDDKLAIYA
jgi:hypothetical protein